MSYFGNRAYRLTFQALPFGAQIGFRPNGKPPDSVLVPGSGEDLSWKVAPDTDDTIRISTGGELKGLDGSVFVRPGTETDCGGASYGEHGVKLGVLSWYEASDEGFPYIPEGYNLSLNVAREVFDRCYQMMLSGRIPSVTVYVQKSPSDKDKEGDAIKHGWEPDGSGKEWNTKDFPYLDVVWYEFSQPINEQAEDIDDEELAGNKPATAKQLGIWLADLKKQIEKINVVLWLLVAAVVANYFLK